MDITKEVLPKDKIKIIITLTIDMRASHHSSTIEKTIKLISLGSLRIQGNLGQQEVQLPKLTKAVTKPIIIPLVATRCQDRAIPTAIKPTDSTEGTKQSTAANSSNESRLTQNLTLNLNTYTSFLGIFDN